ncbi:sulfotransferase [Colwelliaceae bacterium MEBiC 14330]
MTIKNNPLNAQVNITEKQRKSIALAQQAQSSRNYHKAEVEYRKLISENIKLPLIYSQLAFLCAMSKRLEEAESLWSYALTLDPKYFNALMGLADLAKYKRNFKLAKEYYLQAIAVREESGIAYLNLSISLLQLGELDDSELACHKAISYEPKLIQARDNLGQILIAKGALDRAQAVFEQLINENPSNVNALYILGNIFKSQGKLNEASTSYQKAFSIQPSYSQAHFTYASIRQYQSKDDAHIKQMIEQIKLKELPTQNKIQLSFALAKAYEDIKDYPQAFEYLAQGNDLRFKPYNYTISADEAFINNIIDTFNKKTINRLNITAEKSAKPIFIIGMPRSGTTLVEKILSSHNDVHGAGEIDNFFKLATDNFLTESTGFLYSKLDSYEKHQLESVGSKYLQQIQKINQGALHITDKLPFNMLMVGLIKIALPNAKIIHCVREPRDNCLSIFKNNFTTDNYRFAFNLKAIGQFYNLYRKLMAHWHDTFPGAIYEVSYESIVEDSELEIRKLIAACGLEWQDQCLQFDKSQSIVTTASAVQVRKPIYNKSVGIWKKYQDFLQPLFDALGNVG